MLTSFQNSINPPLTIGNAHFAPHKKWIREQDLLDYPMERDEWPLKN